MPRPEVSIDPQVKISLLGCSRLWPQKEGEWEACQVAPSAPQSHPWSSTPNTLRRAGPEIAPSAGWSLSSRGAEPNLTHSFPLPPRNPARSGSRAGAPPSKLLRPRSPGLPVAPAGPGGKLSPGSLRGKRGRARLFVPAFSSGTRPLLPFQKHRLSLPVRAAPGPRAECNIL